MWATQDLCVAVLLCILLNTASTFVLPLELVSVWVHGVLSIKVFLHVCLCTLSCSLHSPPPPPPPSEPTEVHRYLVPWTHTPRWTHTPCWCDGPPEQCTNLTRLMQHAPLASRQFGVVLTLHASDSVTIGVGHTRSLCGCVAVYIVKHCIHICAAIGIGFSLGWFFEVLGSIDISCTLCRGHGCLCA